MQQPTCMWHVAGPSEQGTTYLQEPARIETCSCIWQHQYIKALIHVDRAEDRAGVIHTCSATHFQHHLPQPAAILICPKPSTALLCVSKMS